MKNEDVPDKRLSCSLRASFRFPASFPALASLPSCPKSQRTAAGREGSRSWPRRLPGVHLPQMGSSVRRGQLCLWPRSAQSCMESISSQPCTFIHSKPRTCTPLTGWKEPSLPKVFPLQSHPNTGTDSELGFWGQRLLLTEGFLSFNTTRVCWSSMCTKALLTQAPFRKEIREQVPVFKHQFSACMSAIFCCYTRVLL